MPESPSFDPSGPPVQNFFVRSLLKSERSVEGASTPVIDWLDVSGRPWLWRSERTFREVITLRRLPDGFIRRSVELFLMVP